ncbi:hypothetical protein [Mesorhizobium sp.]|uniref:hypothetical protein n=1 Tax=Mesorhizobium sp. TaxID=1871066 RepID=UPI002580CEBA|nr:hypothetical protein [Mesorhizobium sp.]
MTSQEHVIHVRIADYDKAIEEKFKPALYKAIWEVVDKVAADFATEILDATTYEEGE